MAGLRDRRDVAEQPPFRLALNKAASDGVFTWPCKHYTGRGVVKFNESGAALAQDMGAPVTKMQDSIDAYYEASLERAKDLGGRFTACTSWDEASGKTGSGKKLCHNLISGANFAAQLYHVAIVHSIHPLRHGRLGN